MAIVFLKEKKKEKYLIFALAIVLIFTIIVIWRGFFIKPKLISPPAPKPPEIKINFEILKNPILKNLQPFEEIKPTTESVGRENPFVPY